MSTMSGKRFWVDLKTTFVEWNRHEAPRLGAALSFYTLLSISPLIILVVSLVATLFDRSTVQNQILNEVQAVIGTRGGQAVQSMLENAQKPVSGIAASIVGVCTLLFGASGAFCELRSALNKIWDVRIEDGDGFLSMIRERFVSFGMVLSIGFLLMVSLLFSAGLAVLGKFFGHLLPMPSFVISGLDFVISFLGITALLALIFKFVPQTQIEWRDVRVGAIATALLFTVGKILIGVYLGRASLGSAYGAAGSLIVVIVWVYYSAQIFFFGAEFTHVRAMSRKRPIATVEAVTRVSAA